MGEREKGKENKCTLEEAMDDLFNWDAPQPLSTARRERIKEIAERRQGRFGKRKRRGRGRPILSNDDKEELARGVIKGEYIKQMDSKAPGGRAESLTVGYYYAQAHADFYDRRIVNWKKRIEETPSLMGCFSKVAVTAEICGVPIQDFVSAQFWWFNEVYGRAPTYRDMAGPGAQSRVMQWKSERRVNGVPGKTVHRASQGFVKQETSPDRLLQYEASVLERMVFRWESEEEVWRLFGEPGDEEVFSEFFKRSRRVWRNMYLRWFDLEVDVVFEDERSGEKLSGGYTKEVTVQCLTPQDWAARYVADLKPPSDLWFPSRSRPKSVLEAVRVIREDAPPAEHKWRRVDTPIPGKARFKMWDRMECRLCGVTGRLDGTDNTIVRDKQFGDETYANCGKVIELGLNDDPG